MQCVDGRLPRDERVHVLGIGVVTLLVDDLDLAGTVVPLVVQRAG